MELTGIFRSQKHLEPFHLTFQFNPTKKTFCIAGAHIFRTILMISPTESKSTSRIHFARNSANENSHHYRHFPHFHRTLLLAFGQRSTEGHRKAECTDIQVVVEDVGVWNGGRARGRKEKSWRAASAPKGR
jgi:hypothetical protein